MKQWCLCPMHLCIGCGRIVWHGEAAILLTAVTIGAFVFGTSILCLLVSYS